MNMQQAHLGTSNSKAALVSYSLWCSFDFEVRISECCASGANFEIGTPTPRTRVS